MWTEVLLGAFIVFIATSAGALAVVKLKCPGKQWYGAAIAFSAGIMAFSAVEMLSEAHDMAGDWNVLLGVALGAGALLLTEMALPHVHFHLRKKELEKSKKKTLLIVGALAIHNIPEGFAIASAFAGSASLGWFITAVIGMQDIVEGALVAIPLACYGLRNRDSFGYGSLSGLIEALAAIAGYAFLSMTAFLVAPGLAFAAGAMAYVVLAELAPDAFQKGNERVGAAWFIAGALTGLAMRAML
jgi:ZIP family zinc transporter